MMGAEEWHSGFKAGEIAGLEQQILRALCQGTPEGSVREAAREGLADYHWIEPTHQAIFNALMRLGSDNPEFIREHLPVQLTRMGFPDFDLEELFRALPLARNEVEDLIHRLAATGEQT
jgi:hypothetical protein